MPGLAEWATYARWNSALAAEFFDGRHGGRPVYLDLEDDVLARVAESAGADPSHAPDEELIRAVRPTLGLTTGTSLFGYHVKRLIRWQRGDRQSPPPIVGVLAFQSLVAERMRSDEDLSSANYYGRFLQLLDADPNDANLRTKVTRGFAEHAALMWSALNGWLREAPAIRGLPTARSFDRRVYVGLPMSQALVRASDRSAIRQLFSDLGLRPGQTIAIDDMVRLLRVALPESRVSRGLKTLCRDDHALERVAQVACIELETWSGAVDATASNRNMVLTASLRHLPRRILRLGLAIRPPADVGELRPLPGCDEAGHVALGGATAPIALGEPDDAGWRGVRSRLSIPDLLVGRLQVGNAGFQAARNPRTVVVLGKPADSTQYRETEHVRLGTDHLLLVAEALRARVEAELALVARPGFHVHEALPGLPDGWVLIEGVEILAISNTSDQDLMPLVPLAWTEVVIEGGLRLPGHATWHSASPPEVRASAPPGRAVALTIVSERKLPEVTPERALDTAAADMPDETASNMASSSEERSPERASPEPLPPEPVRQFEECLVLQLSDLELPDGDYRVELFDSRHASRTLSSTTFRLRSASAPLSSTQQPLLAYVLEEPLGSLSAKPDHVGVRGAMVPDLHVPGDSLPEPLPRLTGLLSGNSPDDDDEILDDPPAGDIRRSNVPECLLTGGHYFVLPSAPRGRRPREQEYEGECKLCGLEKRFPARPRKHSRRRPGATDRLSRARLVPPVRLVEPEDPVDYDLILDALCCVGAGTYASLQRIVEQADDRPWAAREIARALVSLGHIDLELDERLRPRAWSVAPPILVASAAGAFLAGWRSPELLFALGQVTHTVGSRVEWTSQPGGPTRVGLLDAADDLEAIASRVSELVGTTLHVARDAPLRIARALPPLESVRQALPLAPVLPDSVPLQRLNEVSLTWEHVDSLRAPGAYRAGARPRLTMHVSEADARISESRLAKWLAVTRTPLIAYAPDRQRAICHLGTEPPGLYERALVLCSGLLPARVDGHLVEYADVPAPVIGALTSRLTRTSYVNA